jgi:hypothetical protein
VWGRLVDPGKGEISGVGSSLPPPLSPSPLPLTTNNRLRTDTVKGNPTV